MRILCSLFRPGQRRGLTSRGGYTAGRACQAGLPLVDDDARLDAEHLRHGHDPHHPELGPVHGREEAQPHAGALRDLLDREAALGREAGDVGGDDGGEGDGVGVGRH